MKQFVYHVKDRKNDDFATTVKEEKINPLPKNYKYIHDTWYEKIGSYLISRIAYLWGFFHMKFRYHNRIINKKLVKENISDGCFLYINHTMRFGDAFMPALLGQKMNYVIVGEQAASMTAILPLMRMVGSIPLSNDMRQFINMCKAVDKRACKNNTITIYPEKHVWPYYTGLRDFDATSFKYPAKSKKKILVVTNCYQKRKHSKKPKLITVIDGPFEPIEALSVTENAKRLRDIAYETMQKRLQEYSTYSYNTYIFEDEENKQPCNND